MTSYLRAYAFIVATCPKWNIKDLWNGMHWTVFNIFFEYYGMECMVLDKKN